MTKEGREVIDNLKACHYMAKAMLENKQFIEFEKFILSKCQSTNDEINFLKTMQIVAHPYANHPEVKTIYNIIDTKFKTKLKELPK